ncbi:MAG: DUF2785 domain-containing protein [Nocardioidaceae bacterium]
MRAGFWQHVLDSDMAVPPERPLNDLTAELVTMLGSADPVERDAVAYPVLATWLSEGVYDDLLVSFGDGVTQGLKVGLGESDGDQVFRRTFSALMLAECVTRDNTAHILPVDAVVSWADRGLTWFVRERDLRAFVPGKGWAHALAHGADLIGALARSHHFGPTELAVLLDVIADRLVEPTPFRLSHGEDDRMAYATMAILHRDVLEQQLVDAWVRRLGATAHSQPDPDHGPGDEWPPAHVHNTRSFLRVLYLQLTMGVRGCDADDSAYFARRPEIRADLLLILRDELVRLLPFAHQSQ